MKDVEKQLEDAVTKLGVALESFGEVLKLVGKGVQESKEPEDIIADAHKEEVKTTKKKTKRKRRTKKEIEEAKAKQPAKETTASKETKVEDDFGDFEDFEDEKKVTITDDDLRKQFVAYAKATSKEDAFKVLAKYNAKKVADLPKDSYQKVWEEVQISC